ncbi:hypothetical protein RclHR1_04630013 [Rhizophagus clarus]|uniref:Uncharacterized protein n=1 Tax=Rhizophagus clarus TaxID=94130 RepID=A0A2Z6SC50_9GLOM|nr:hypothetical protein RclHR1_04630013 [Rhizophagus clarus]
MRSYYKKRNRKRKIKYLHQKEKKNNEILKWVSNLPYQYTKTDFENYLFNGSNPPFLFDPTNGSNPSFLFAPTNGSNPSSLFAPTNGLNSSFLFAPTSSVIYPAN